MTDVAKRQALYSQSGPSCGRICRSPICTMRATSSAMTAKLKASAPMPDGMIRMQGLEMAK